MKIKNIYLDSEYLKSFGKSINTKKNLEEVVNFPINLLLKLYSHKYDFTQNELSDLIYQLDFLDSGKLTEILIFIYFHNYKVKIKC
uniref:Uncharacterized protein n=1 Tax=viral metagenome TaxID=1070528 RepID=A0A6C0ADH3_9ZZZZ